MKNKYIITEFRDNLEFTEKKLNEIQNDFSRATDYNMPMIERVSAAADFRIHLEELRESIREEKTWCGVVLDE